MKKFNVIYIIFYLFCLFYLVHFCIEVFNLDLLTCFFHYFNLASPNNHPLIFSALGFSFIKKEESTKNTKHDIKLINLDPYYVVGLTDAEATFTISISKYNRERKTMKNNIIFTVHPSFAISLNSKDINILYSLQSFFKVGNIKQDLSNNAITYYVNSVKDLNNVIIPFFDKYKLISQKNLDFTLFKAACELIGENVHTSLEGLNKIVSIKASMNKGLSAILIEYFPNFLPTVRPLSLDLEIKDANWLAGFTDGEGYFYIRTKKAETSRSVNRISFFFSIDQSVRDASFIYKISKFLNCGTTSLSANGKYIQFRVTKFEDIGSKIIPFFKNYLLRGIKRLNFEDFVSIMVLVKSKIHLTSEGLNKINTIKEGMNLNRK